MIAKNPRYRDANRTSAIRITREISRRLNWLTLHYNLANQAEAIGWLLDRAGIPIPNEAGEFAVVSAPNGHNGCHQ